MVDTTSVREAMRISGTCKWCARRFTGVGVKCATDGQLALPAYCKPACRTASLLDQCTIGQAAPGTCTGCGESCHTKPINGTVICTSCIAAAVGGCWRKIRHPSGFAARTAVTATTSGPMNAYLCQLCRGWHLTKGRPGDHRTGPELPPDHVARTELLADALTGFDHETVREIVREAFHTAGYTVAPLRPATPAETPAAAPTNIPKPKPCPVAGCSRPLPDTWGAAMAHIRSHALDQVAEAADRITAPARTAVTPKTVRPRVTRKAPPPPPLPVLHGPCVVASTWEPLHPNDVGVVTALRYTYGDAYAYAQILAGRSGPVTVTVINHAGEAAATWSRFTGTWGTPGTRKR